MTEEGLAAAVQDLATYGFVALESQQDVLHLLRKLPPEVKCTVRRRLGPKIWWIVEEVREESEGSKNKSGSATRRRSSLRSRLANRRGRTVNACFHQ